MLLYRSLEDERVIPSEKTNIRLEMSKHKTTVEKKCLGANDFVDTCSRATTGNGFLESFILLGILVIVFDNV